MLNYRKHNLQRAFVDFLSIMMKKWLLLKFIPISRLECSFIWILRAVYFPVKHSCLYNKLIQDGHLQCKSCPTLVPFLLTYIDIGHGTVFHICWIVIGQCQARHSYGRKQVEGWFVKNRINGGNSNQTIAMRNVFKQFRISQNFSFFTSN